MGWFAPPVVSGIIHQGSLLGFDVSEDFSGRYKPPKIACCSSSELQLRVELGNRVRFPSGSSSALAGSAVLAVDCCHFLPVGE